MDQNQTVKELQSSLSHQKCVPCEGTEQPLSNEEEDKYLSAVPNWNIDRENTHKISITKDLGNFKSVLEMVQKIGALAEAEGHHPNLNLHDFKMLSVELYTHAINGLSMNDFIMATKIDELFAAQAN